LAMVMAADSVDGSGLWNSASKGSSFFLLSSFLSLT